MGKLRTAGRCVGHSSKQRLPIDGLTDLSIYGPVAAGVTIRASHLRQVSEIDGMFERLRPSPRRWSCPRSVTCRVWH